MAIFIFSGVLSLSILKKKQILVTKAVTNKEISLSLFQLTIISTVKCDKEQHTFPAKQGHVMEHLLGGFLGKNR